MGDLAAFGIVGEWQGSCRVTAGERQGMCELVFNAAWERHGNGMVFVCESALKGLIRKDKSSRWQIVAKK
jgi:hypothetical protein